jgi:hypothetical protein
LGGDGLWRKSFPEFFLVIRPMLLALFTVGFGLLATYRTFGFDLEGGVRDLYPYVADGWGLWYWLAQAHLDFNTFFCIINLVFAAQIFVVSFPAQERRHSVAVSIMLLLYMALWFLFGQARYGMALAVLTPAISGAFPVFILCSGIAILLHKAAAGPVALLLLWRLLNRKKYGLIAAVVICCIFSYVVSSLAEQVMVLAGYAVYLNWGNLPSANTPLKFYWAIAVLLLWRFRDKQTSQPLLILTLISLPFSYFIVFAGRTFEMYSVLVLYCLARTPAPRSVKFLFLVPYFADLGNLLFNSGFYF